MFPTVKKRVYTEQRQNKKIKKSQSILLNSRINESSIKACIPYLHELKLSLRCTPQKYLPSNQNKKIQTSIRANNFQSQQHIFQIPEQINKQCNDSTTPSQSEIKTCKKNTAQIRLLSLLRQFQRLNLKDQEESKTLPMKNNSLIKKYNQCITQFDKLPKNKKMWNQESIKQFYLALIKINPFFKKLKQGISLCLLKVGHIRLFGQNQIIQKQSDNITMIGIVLWGQVLMKSSVNKMKIYLFPGDSLNEQLIFSNNKQAVRDLIYSKGGSYIAKENVKAKTESGILFLKVSEYNMIYQQLVKIRERSNILLAENMMKWSFAKKKNNRKEFSHL